MGESLPLDVIVRFTGGPGGNRCDEDRERAFRQFFNTPDYLKTHQPIEVNCYMGFREQEQFVEAAVSNVRRRRDETSSGVTIVIGSSAGGVSALKAACAFAEVNVHLNYLGINDAAFLSSKDEVTFTPQFAINLRSVTSGKAINADIKENFFQTVGHGWQYDDDSPTGYESYAEFHGTLPGFINVDLSMRPRVLAVKGAYGAADSLPGPLPVSARDRFAAAIHKQAGGSAENLLWPRITNLIKP